MPKITRTGGTGTTSPAAPEGISAADQSKIMKLISDEMKKTGDAFKASGKPPGPVMKYMVHPPAPGPTMKYMVHPPKPQPGPVMKYMVPSPGPTMKYMVHPPGGGDGGIVAKYMVRPPGAGGGGIVAKYMVVPPDVVAKYMVVPPWAGVDAHQAVLNKVTADGKLTKTEANLLCKLFNRDIAEARKEGRDITAKVTAFLHKNLDKLSGDKATKDIIFGAGGPGYRQPVVVAKYMVRPR
jgi:hypothetical protein